MARVEQGNQTMRHEIVSSNPDVDVRFYLSDDAGSYVTPHWHDSYELVYMIEGSMTVFYENGKRVLNSGEFIVVNSRVVHSVLSTKNRAIVLQIPKEVLRRYVPDIDSYIFEVDMHPGTDVDRTRLERIKKIFTDMYVVYDIQPEGYILKFNSLLYDLLFSLIHSYSTKITRTNIDKDNRYLERLNDIMAYLKEHHREQIRIGELADEFGNSEDYLARFFKRQTGMTIMEYLYAYRITKVYQDLIGTDLPVSEILDRHGCSNYRVAMRTFKEFYGCTPLQKRKQMLQK